MTGIRHTPYVPGMYTKKRMNAAAMADQCIREWEMRKQTMKRKQEAEEHIHNSHYISFSRKIGVGALEIADLLAEKIGHKVVDRQIIEHIAEQRSVRTNTLDDFDERYPGIINNFVSLLFGEKSFTMGDYMRHLVDGVLQIAETGPTIFVGRATHLILPRENVLAVRFISSREHRAKRVADILNISVKEALVKLDEEDKFQREFFRKNFGKKDASPYEFDLVINRDYLTEAHDAAELVYRAYVLKFGEAVVKAAGA